MNEEVWKPVVGYDGIYEVSSHGKVRAMFACRGGRYKAGRILTPLNHNHGYLCVKLYYPGAKQSGRMRTIHSLVLEAFRGPRPKSGDSRHLDGNRKNNHLSNLEWGTRRENVHDAIRHGTFKSGEKCEFSKLNKEEVLKIRHLFDSGALCKELASQFNISIPQAYRIGVRKSWKMLAES